LDHNYNSLLSSEKSPTSVLCIPNNIRQKDFLGFRLLLRLTRTGTAQGLWTRLEPVWAAGRADGETGAACRAVMRRCGRRVEAEIMKDVYGKLVNTCDESLPRHVAPMDKTPEIDHLESQLYLSN
jgi:hypothetical protein